MLRRSVARCGAVAGLLLLTLGLGMARSATVPDRTAAGWSAIPPIAPDPVHEPPFNVDPATGPSIRLQTGTPPSVDRRIPGPGATNVPSSATVTIGFTEVVVVTPSSFKLECPSGTPVEFNADLLPLRTHLLTPVATLPGGVTCAVTVVADQVHNQAGVQMAANASWSFTIDVPPTVTSTTPRNAATGVAGSANLTVSFSKPVAVTTSSFGLQCPSGTPVVLAVSPLPPPDVSTFTLTPAATLPAGVTCAATVVAAAVHDSTGTQMVRDHPWVFTVDVPPTVTSTIPLDGATQVGPAAALTINFSKRVNVDAGPSPAFKIECPAGTSIPIRAISPSPPGGVNVFNLTASPPPDTLCTVTVIASGVQDVVAGTAMARDHAFSYTTDTAPTVTSTVPANGATSVALDSTVIINFSKAVNVVPTAFRLECPRNTPETFIIAPGPPGGATAFTLTPTANLPAGTTCTATVAGALVEDLLGTALGVSDDFSFTTVSPLR